jgi:DNA-binding response OmpR family regulator
MARIAVIDDDADVRDYIGLALEGGGHEIVGGGDGREALRLLEDGSIDLLIIDILMPNQDGLETIMTLRKNGLGVPVLAISAGGLLDSGYLLRTAKSFGADEVLAKPFEPETLRERVDALLAN